ncbi:MAG: hypothetical protein CVU56_24230 [Deltaproteobacteria bacterium HGW-Deltaproteobacteria-14]|jgi:POT family proton-dependent oligopeptide transporter|nr:MAG: hypothetical protein CVU56_24230 [Deltaproteobacteria bacterium HGW-Deltaproteobacteria-14]
MTDPVKDLVPGQDDAAANRYPAGIPFIVGNEAAERFSFYGMRAILYVYLVGLFTKFLPEAQVDPAAVDAAKAHATEIVHMFIAGVYLFPLIGAVVSDRLLGKYKVIFWVSIIYFVGNAIMAGAGQMGAMGDFEGAEIAVFAGLGFIALGSGGIKPCVSANVGDQFTAKNGHLVTRIFQLFYFIINFGSFIATIIIPWVYALAGPAIAFGIPGVLMALATFVFWLGRKRFVHVPPSPGGKLGLLDAVATLFLLAPIFGLLIGFFGMRHSFEAAKDASFIGHFGVLILIVGAVFALGIFLSVTRQKAKPQAGFLTVLAWSFLNRSVRKPGQGFFDPAREKFGEEAGDGPPSVLRVVLVFSAVMFFWALFDQHASTWIEQASQMDLHMVVPATFGWAVLGAVAVLTIYGGTWVMLHVSNVRIPRAITLGIMGVLGAALVITGVIDLITGEQLRFEIGAAQMAALNPLMVMIIIPLLNVAVWGPLRRRGRDLKPLLKMAIGMFMAAVAFGIAALLQQVIEAKGPGEVHALWQFFQYLIMTTAEVLVSVTGLEFAYTQAPRAMKSTLMGFWLFFVAAGNMIVVAMAPLQADLDLSDFFLVFAGLMVAAAVVFSFLASMYKGKTYLQA